VNRHQVAMILRGANGLNGGWGDVTVSLTPLQTHLGLITLWPWLSEMRSRRQTCTLFVNLRRPTPVSRRFCERLYQARFHDDTQDGARRAQYSLTKPAG